MDDSKLSEIQEKKDAACGVIQEIANVLVSRRGVKGYGNPLLVYADAREAMLDAYAKGKGNPEKVLGEMNREGFYQATKEEIQRFCQAMKELRNLPTKYLEAKPARAVAFGEVAAAIVPGDISLEAMDVLQRNRVKAYTYRPGDAEDRLRAVNQAADESQGIRFSLSDAVPSKAGYTVESVNENSGSQLNAASGVYCQPAIVYSPEEVPATSAMAWLRARCRDYARENGIIGEHECPCLGNDVNVQTGGIKSVVHHQGSDIKNNLIAVIPDMLKNAVLVQTEGNGHSRTHILAVKVRYGEAER